MAGILEGIRVLDWSWWHQGPAVSYILGDMGAQVIKIEDPVQGDAMRGTRRFMGIPVDLPGGRNVLFELANRNKKSIVLNLKHPRGKEAFYRLVEKSDVFINNFRPSVRQRLGLDYPTLARHNPRLVYATASGWGRDGPDNELRSFDTLGVARSGLMFNIGEPGPAPQQMVFGIADQMGATMVAFGILAALFYRERTGVGQEVESSLFGTMVHAQAIAVAASLLLGQDIPRPSRHSQFNPLIGWYQCQDGEWVIFAHNQPQEFWHNFCQALGLGHLEDDPRFETTKARGDNNKELIALIDQTVARRPRKEWLEIFRQHDLVFSPVQRLSELAKDPQALDNRYIVDLDHPVLGHMQAVGFPVQFSQTPCAVQGPAPEFGQHTEEVLIEVAGYSWEDIASLREAGAI